MKYIFEDWTIGKLLDIYQKDLLNLNPPYQRNDIWSLPAKKRLIDTIKEGFPLPSFFLYLNNQGVYEMVDGQQRTRTFLAYEFGLFPDSNKIWFKESDTELLLNRYKLCESRVENVQKMYKNVDK